MVALLFISFVVCLALGVPVAFSLGISSLLYFIGNNMSLYMFAQRFFAGLNSFTLLCIPGFVFAGALMNQGGITERLIGFCNKIVGHITGGLSIANVAASMLFAGISGTALADTVSVGGVLIPAMKKEGYDADFSCAVTAASSCIGPIIPPSVPMIMAATMTGLSVSKMFVAGMIPGILIGVSLCIYTTFYCKKRNYINKEAKPFSWGNVFHALKDGIWALLVPVIILGGIYGGIFTPTEAAAVAVAYGLIVGLFVYRDLKFKDLYNIFSNAALTTATVLIILGTANTFGRILTLQRIPTMIADAFTSISDSKYVLLVLINLLLLVVGCFMETNAAIIILAPIFLPIVEAAGVDPVHFGIIMVVNLAIGFVTPPLGVNLFVACNTAGAKLEEIVKGIIPILGVMIIDLLLITYIPQLTMLLSNLLNY